MSWPVKRKRGTVNLLQHKILLLCFRIELGFIELTTIDILKAYNCLLAIGVDDITLSCLTFIVLYVIRETVDMIEGATTYYLAIIFYADFCAESVDDLACFGKTNS